MPHSRMRLVQLCYDFPNHRVLGVYIGSARSSRGAVRIARREGFETREVEGNGNGPFLVHVMPEQLPFPAPAARRPSHEPV